MAVGSIDVTYRGIFQKSLAAKITKELVVAAIESGKKGGTVQRYGDSPERNGIPAKQFAVIAESEDELRLEMTRYEPGNVRVLCVMDDTLTKGVESWAWYGVRPINLNLAPGGTLLVVSRRSPDELLEWIPRKDFAWQLAVLEGDPSFAGLWVYNDDGTDYRTMGAVARVTSEFVDLSALSAEAGVKKNATRLLDWLDEGYRAVTLRPVRAGEGAEDTYVPVEMPGWTEMREGLAIPAIEVGKNNELFQKFTTRTQRPLVRFDACVKCQICYLECPDESFIPTPEGHYEVNYGHCCGCGLCAEVCPVRDCIVMVDEEVFESNESLHALWEKDRQAYKELVDAKIAEARKVNAHYGIF